MIRQTPSQGFMLCGRVIRLRVTCERIRFRGAIKNVGDNRREFLKMHNEATDIINLYIALERGLSKKWS